MVDQIAMYRTSDGQVFLTAEEAAIHQAEINIDADLAQFAAALEAAGYGRNIKAQVKAIRNYLMWKNGVPVPAKKGE